MKKAYISNTKDCYKILKMFSFGFDHLNPYNFGCTPMYYPNFYYATQQISLDSSFTNPTYVAFNYQSMPFIEEGPNFSTTSDTQVEVISAEKGMQANKNQKLRGQKKILRPKKNVESNISNQVFSYITSEHKSGKALSKILKKNKQKMQLYYIYVESFAKSKKKYLSRKYLGDLCIFSLDRQQCQEIHNKNKLDILSLEQFRSAISFLIFHYLRSKCTISVLTSMKLSPELRRQHLERKRQILTYLEEYVRPDYRYGFR